MARLELTGYIDVKQDHLGFGYHITPADEPLEDWVRLIAPHEQQIGTVLRTFGRRPTHELELAATIHFVKGLFPSVSTGEILRRVRWPAGFPGDHGPDHPGAGHRVTVVVENGEALLIDAGLRGSSGTILQGLETLGLFPEQIGMVVITHAHPDHSGGPVMQHVVE